MIKIINKHHSARTWMPPIATTNTDPHKSTFPGILWHTVAPKLQLSYHPRVPPRTSIPPQSKNTPQCSPDPETHPEHDSDLLLVLGFSAADNQKTAHTLGFMGSVTQLMGSSEALLLAEEGSSESDKHADPLASLPLTPAQRTVTRNRFHLEAAISKASVLKADHALLASEGSNQTSFQSTILISFQLQTPELLT